MSESHFAMVSDWMDNGSINEFLRRNPDVDRLDLVRMLSEFLLRFERTDEQIGDPAERRCCRADLYSSAGNDPRGSQRRTFSMPRAASLSYYLSW